MAKIQLDLPEETHLMVRKEQLTIEIEEKKKLTLKEVYERLINEGLERVEERRKA